MTPSGTESGALTGTTGIKSSMSKSEEQSGLCNDCFNFKDQSRLNLESLICRYEIYNAKSGKFLRKGDGGYLNVSSPCYLSLAIQSSD